MTARALGLCCALASCALSCSALQSPEGAVADAADVLEAAPPALRLPGGGELKLTKLRIEPPHLAPAEGGEARVNASVWAEGEVRSSGGASTPLLFHGPEQLVLRKAGFFQPWRFAPELPTVASLAAALLARTPPAKVAAWAVGADQPSRAEVREEYVKDAAGRPAFAARRLLAAREGLEPKWRLSDP